MRIGALAIGAGVLSGCAGGGVLKAAGVPELPERGCWGVFDRADLARVVGDGDEATVNVSGGFVLARDNQVAACHVDVDGEGRFLAEAKRPPGPTVSLSAPETAEDGDGATDGEAGDAPGDEAGAEPEPLPFGIRGRVWADGAAVTFTCERPLEDPFEVRLRISGRVREATAQDTDDQRVLTSLMRQYFDSAQRQLLCEA
ncbi:hypothetical protein [Streptomyces sp. G-G2]|uniref:hypothetical protein n=1 Tax=Streptomyces sp. G-G2 TaxID=3046201 RepID=UPI0024BA2C1F|nr:hypothetical protein [Streptomyces sp. G-G2]MDJ0379585.1 hypothetical protein [Streptomyces sp. G-G2]